MAKPPIHRLTYSTSTDGVRDVPASERAWRDGWIFVAIVTACLGVVALVVKVALGI